MRFAQAGALAALVSLSSSFLIPPAISQADTDIVNTLPFEDATTIETRVMEINCPGCLALPTAEGKMRMKQPPTILKLNFSIVHEDRDVLLVNGFRIYPMVPLISDSPLTAPLLALTTDNTWLQTWSPDLGFSVSEHHPVAYSKQDQMDLVAIHFEIMEVGGKFLSGLSSVDIKLLETPSGKLMIGDAQISRAKSAAPKSSNDHECTTILCKWKAIIADRLSKIKGCGSKSHSSVAKTHSDSNPDSKPHHGHHSRPFRHHHRHGRVARFFRGIILHVLIPILIGVMLGITASLIGMVAGHIVVFAWRTVFRRGERQQYIEVKQEEDSDVKGLVIIESPPPEYEEAVVEKSGQ